MMRLVDQQQVRVLVNEADGRLAVWNEIGWQLVYSLGGLSWFTHSEALAASASR